MIEILPSVSRPVPAGQRCNPSKLLPLAGRPAPTAAGTVTAGRTTTKEAAFGLRAVARLNAIVRWLFEAEHLHRT